MKAQPISAPTRLHEPPGEGTRPATCRPGLPTRCGGFRVTEQVAEEQAVSPPRTRLSVHLGLAFLLGACLSLSAAEGKQTEMVPMRDGVRLATDIYLPEGAGPWPVILARTPYNKVMGAGIGADGAKRGYTVVVQDCRGRFASEGDNLPFHLDHTDGPDTLKWLQAQPWCNGKVGTWGGSAGAITQLLMVGRDAPEPYCQHLVVGAPDLYAGIYPGGVFKKAMIEDWIRGSRFGTNALAAWEAHPAYDDYWRTRDVSPRYTEAATVAVHLGGWYDIFAQGTIDSFVGYQTRGGPAARGRQKLVMGPWTHGVLQTKAGDLTFPDNAKRPPNDIHDSWKWFDAQLKGEDNGLASAPAVTYYVMGDVTDPQAPGNVWRTADQWPPVATQTQAWYLQADRTLRAAPPGNALPLAYLYDPGDPVPTIGGLQLTLPAGGKDQRPIESRPDVLVFTSAPLTEPLEVTGRVRAKLWVSSDAPDTDFFVRLCDVYPDGRSINVCEGQLRARFRHGFDRETFLKTGEVYPLEIDLWSTSLVFNRGHCLRVHVTSSSAPGYDPNPNTGDPFRARDYRRAARNVVFLDAQRPSHLLLPVAAGGR